MQQPEPVGLAAAALIAQFGLLAILVIGAAVLGPTKPRTFFMQRVGLAWTIVFIAVLSLGALILSEPITRSGQALFRDTPLPTMSFGSALVITFWADTVGIWYIIRGTGGAVGSPFVPLMVFLPTVAIFLRQPFSFVCGYAALITVLMLWDVVAAHLLVGAHYFPDYGEQKTGRFAASSFLVVALALVLTIVVGYATRP